MDGMGYMPIAIRPRAALSNEPRHQIRRPVMKTNPAANANRVDIEDERFQLRRACDTHPMRHPVSRGDWHTWLHPRAFPLNAGKSISRPTWSRRIETPVRAESAKDIPHQSGICITLIFKIAHEWLQLSERQTHHRSNRAWPTIRTPLLARATRIFLSEASGDRQEFRHAALRSDRLSP